MSYAGRLVQMSGNAAPIARPVVREEVEHTEAEVLPSQAAPRTAATTITAATESPRRAPAALTVSEPRVATRAALERSAPEPAREHTRVVEKLVAASMPVPPAVPIATVAQPTITQHEIVHEWLADREDGADPLDSISADGEMRELLRAVRGWTSGVPAAREPVEDAAIVEISAAEPPLGRTPAPTPVQAAVAPPVEPVQVSIGNVVITIEDVPAATPARRSVAPASDAEGWLARHYWRER